HLTDLSAGASAVESVLKKYRQKAVVVFRCVGTDAADRLEPAWFERTSANGSSASPAVLGSRSYSRNGLEECRDGWQATPELLRAQIRFLGPDPAYAPDATWHDLLPKPALFNGTVARAVGELETLVAKAP